jgi:hypothetical protein
MLPFPFYSPGYSRHYASESRTEREKKKKKEEPAKKNDSSFLANKTTYAAKRKDRKRYVRE